MTMNDIADAPPPGFNVGYPHEPFENFVGPHYFRHEDGCLVGGFRAKTQHGNSAGSVHGGALTAFADSVLTGVALEEVDKTQTWVATITLNCEFVGPARVGDWVECRGAVTRLTRSFAFVRGEMTVEDRIVLTCSSVLKLTHR